jgi:hypothetical protein
MQKKLPDDIKKEIEKIIDGLQCPKDFKCYKSGFELLCSAKDIGIASFLECLEKKPEQCKFSFPFGLIYLCECPLRIYLAKKMKKSLE